MELCCFRRIVNVPCQYEDTDSYVITKTFVNNRQHFLNQLLNEET